MKSRILSVAIALSLIAVVFAAIPLSTQAAVYYTGTVQTTDDEGNPNDVFFRGEQVYVAVETFYQGVNGSEEIRVELQTESGTVRDWFEAVTSDPEGTYESWAASPWPEALNTGYSFSGDMIVYDVVLYIDTGDFWTEWEEVDRVPIVVREQGLTLDPPAWFSYYPGQEVTVTIMTTNTDDLFYVQVVNDTFEDFENWTRLDTADGWYSFVWVIDSDMPDGWYTMNVRAQDNDVVWYSASFSIQKYALIIDSDRSYVMPGEVVDIVYDVVEIATLTHCSSVDIEWNAVYNNSVDGNGTWVDGTLVGSSGVFEYEIPLDIAMYSDLEMSFWANDSDDRSAEAWLWFTIALLDGDVDVDSGPYIPGDSVRVSANAMVGWDDIAGAEVDVVVEKNGTAIAAYGASDLMTDASGEAAYEFVLGSGATMGTYIVKATVSYLGSEVQRWNSFEVTWNGWLRVELDREYYFGGQTATFTFDQVWNNEVVSANSVFYIIYDEGGIAATGNTSTGTGSYDIPEDYVGYLEVQATTILNGYFLNGWDDADVLMGDLLLSAMAESYRAGDTVTFAYHAITGVENATLSYVVTDDDGVRVASGTIPFMEQGSFDFVVPEANPSESYTAKLTMNDGAGHVMSASDSVWLYAEYEIEIWIASSSGYTSRAYEPGDVLEIGYRINTVGVAHLDLYRISFYASGDYVDHNVLVSSPEGSFDYEIPEGATDGSFWLYAYLYDPVGGGGTLSSDGTAFAVKADQSVWDRSVGGLSLFNVIVLVLLLLMVIMLVVMPWVRGRSGAEPGPKPRSMEHSQTPPPPEEPGEKPE